MKTGVLLINLGTPDSPSTKDVRRYLREFLSDPRVIDLPTPVRWLLLNAIILPFRPKKSAHAYQQIWTKKGSPLLIYGQELTSKLSSELGDNYVVALGMRYGKPCLQDAISQLSRCGKIIIVPLFPQYSSAATGSAIQASLEIIQQRQSIPSLEVISDFYRQKPYIECLSQHIKSHWIQEEFLLFSYYGIPERQIIKAGCQQVCTNECSNINSENFYCYRAQCYETTRLIAKTLVLKSENYTTSFQSRLGKTPWIKPYTDETLEALVKQGIKKIAITCPAFVADCLETIEEIGIQAKQQWLELGGESLRLVPALNAEDYWVKALAKIIM